MTLRLKNVAIHPGSGNIIVVAEFPVPPDRLFRALTAAEEIGRWWGSPRSVPTLLWVGVPVKGTSWRAEGSRVAGRAAFTAFGDFLDVDAPRQMQMSWHGSWDQMMPTRIDARLEPVLGGSVLTLLHQGFMGREQACLRQGRIWYRAMKRLKAYLQAEASLGGRGSGQMRKAAANR